MKKKQIQLDRVVGIRSDGEFVSIDYFFNHEDGFRGVIGTSFAPVSKEEYEYRTSQEGAEEHLAELWSMIQHNEPDTWKQYVDKDMQAAVIQDIALCTSIYDKIERLADCLDVGNDLEKAEEAKDAAQEAIEALKKVAFSEYVSQIRQYDDEIFWDHSGCCSGAWEQIRKHDPENMGEDKVELFECIGGGRTFGNFGKEDASWVEVWDEHLLDWIAWWERGGFRQYTTGILGEFTLRGCKQ